MNQYFRVRCTNYCKSIACFAGLVVLIVFPWLVGMARILVWVFGD